MKLSSFKVGEYAIDSDGEVVKILKKTGRGDNLSIELEEIKTGENTPRHRCVGDIFEASKNYGCTHDSDQWERWTPPQGNPEILAKIQEARKNLEDLEKAYKDSLKPKVEFIPGMAYDLSEYSEGEVRVGVFTSVDNDGDYRFIIGDDGDSYYIRSNDSQKAKPLTKPNQKKAAKIIYDFCKQREFPEN